MTLQECIKQILDEKCTAYSLDDEGDRKMVAYALARGIEGSLGAKVTLPDEEKACSNCGQWVRNGDCTHECKKRGFA